MTKMPTKGTVLQLSIATVYTTVAGISDISEPDEKPILVDGTAMDSGQSLEDAIFTGHSAPGSVKGNGFYDPTDTVHKAVQAAKRAGSSESWKITNANISGYSVSFTGICMDFTAKHAVKDLIKASIDIKLNALCVLAP